MNTLTCLWGCGGRSVSHLRWCRNVLICLRWVYHPSSSGAEMRSDVDQPEQASSELLSEAEESSRNVLLTTTLPLCFSGSCWTRAAWLTRTLASTLLQGTFHTGSDISKHQSKSNKNTSVCWRGPAQRCSAAGTHDRRGGGATGQLLRPRLHLFIQSDLVQQQANLGSAGTQKSSSI